MFLLKRAEARHNPKSHRTTDINEIIRIRTSIGGSDNHKSSDRKEDEKRKEQSE